VAKHDDYEALRGEVRRIVDEVIRPVAEEIDRTGHVPRVGLPLALFEAGGE
jgi:hypothetical protein